MLRSAATMATSVPVSTTVQAAAMASTATVFPLTQANRLPRWGCGAPTSWTGRIGGLATQSRASAASIANAQANSAHGVEITVASRTPSAGPTMKEISMATE